MTRITRRSALGALFALVPSAALARKRNAWPGYSGGVAVDVSPLRRNGDNVDADFLADVLPGYLRQSFGPGHDVLVRIDDVTYGVGGSDGGYGSGAIDTIEGVGRVNGREVPLTCSVVATVYQPDVGGYGAHFRQDTLARSFAQWLPRQLGM